MNDKLIKLISEKPLTPFASPEQEIYIFESDVKNDIDIDEVTKIILSNERNIIEKHPPLMMLILSLGNESLTSLLSLF